MTQTANLQGDEKIIVKAEESTGLCQNYNRCSSTSAELQQAAVTTTKQEIIFKNMSEKDFVFVAQSILDEIINQVCSSCKHDTFQQSDNCDESASVGKKQDLLLTGSIR